MDAEEKFRHVYYQLSVEINKNATSGLTDGFATHFFTRFTFSDIAPFYSRYRPTIIMNSELKSDFGWEVD